MTSVKILDVCLTPGDYAHLRKEYLDAHNICLEIMNYTHPFDRLLW